MIGQDRLFEELDIEKRLKFMYVGILMGFFVFYRTISTIFLARRAKDIQ